jgi:hypothetical protein
MLTDAEAFEIQLKIYVVMSLYQNISLTEM